ncbi:MAG: amidohydrolase [Methanobacteriota archaeon]|nr:MAG: amidohydrolase [Euryarchaeota archaeon]
MQVAVISEIGSAGTKVAPRAREPFSRDAGSPTAMSGVTDVHVHVQPFRMLKPDILESMKRERPQFPQLIKMSEDPSVLLRILDEAGVERACLINYVAPDVMGFLPTVNDYVLKYAKADRDRLIPFGSIHPAYTKDVKKEAEVLVKADLGGFKIHPPHQLLFPNDPRLEPLYDVAEEAGVPVMIHTGTSTFPAAKSRYGDPITVDDVAVDHPDLKIILAHGGRPLWCDTAFFIARRHRNAYIDISSIPPKRLLAYFPRLEEIGEKVLFGSDWPGPGVPGIREELDGIAGLPITKELRDKVLVRNARKVFP